MLHCTTLPQTTDRCGSFPQEHIHLTIPETSGCCFAPIEVPGSSRSSAAVLGSKWMQMERGTTAAWRTPTLE